MNAYETLKEKHQKEVNAFPMAFAFSDKQFAEGMAKLGLKPEDTDKVYGMAGTGGFYRRSDAPAFHEMFERHEREKQEAIEADKTGNGYIYQMFIYELHNHEYGYTGDPESALNALDLTPEEIGACPRLKHGFIKARNKIRKRRRRRN
jgi:hypothetical protein